MDLGFVTSLSPPPFWPPFPARRPAARSARTASGRNRRRDGPNGCEYEGHTSPAALDGADVTSEDANLHEWPKNPEAKVPGTKIIVAGYPDDK